MTLKKITNYDKLNKTVLWILLIVIVVVCIAATNTKPNPVERWEYYVGLRDKGYTESSLNSLGAEGWELVLRNPSNGDLIFKRKIR
jgi:hypothetical protein